MKPTPYVVTRSRPYLGLRLTEGGQPYLETEVERAAQPYLVAFLVNVSTSQRINYLCIVLANWPTDQPINYLEVSASSNSGRQACAFGSQTPKPAWYSQYAQVKPDSSAVWRMNFVQRTRAG